MNSYYRISPHFRIASAPRGVLVAHGGQMIFIGQERLNFLIELLRAAQRQMGTESLVINKGHAAILYNHKTGLLIAEVGVLEPLEWRFEPWELPALIGGLSAYRDEMSPLR